MARQLQRGFVLVGGLGLVLVGLAMVVLPGPGLLVIIGGLALLGTEFTWAQGLLVRLRTQVQRSSAWARARMQSLTGTEPEPVSVRLLPPTDRP